MSANRPVQQYPWRRCSLRQSKANRAISECQHVWYQIFKENIWWLDVHFCCGSSWELCRKCIFHYASYGRQIRWFPKSGCWIEFKKWDIVLCERYKIDSPVCLYILLRDPVWWQTLRSMFPVLQPFSALRCVSNMTCNLIHKKLEFSCSALLMDKAEHSWGSFSALHGKAFLVREGMALMRSYDAADMHYTFFSHVTKLICRAQKAFYGLSPTFQVKLQRHCWYLWTSVKWKIYCTTVRLVKKQALRRAKAFSQKDNTA